jgi:hypothetical protein
VYDVAWLEKQALAFRRNELSSFSRKHSKSFKHHSVISQETVSLRFVSEIIHCQKPSHNHKTLHSM